MIRKRYVPRCTRAVLTLLFRNTKRTLLILMLVTITANSFYYCSLFQCNQFLDSEGRPMSLQKLLFNKDDPSQLYYTAKNTVLPANLTGYKLAAEVNRRCSSLISPYRQDETLTAFMIHQMTYISKGRHALYCPVEKVASTFWRRFIYQVNHKDLVKHPYRVPIARALGGQKFTHPNDNTTERLYADDHFKFLFVRDPFHRILSAYVDKIFVPNPMFWGRFGEHSIKMFRKNDTRKCYHDTTFSEFVQFVVYASRNMKHIDPHFLPASQMCLPCDMNFTFIGKMESFKADVVPVFEKFGLKDSIPFLQNNMTEYSDIDAIQDSISSPYYWKRDITKCMNWHEAVLRVWRKLQMRGLISTEKRYTKTVNESQTITRQQLINMALKARKESDPIKLKQQKKDIFIEMYRSVPLDVLHELIEVFKSDLYLFGYDQHPKELFDRTIQYNFHNISDFRN